MTAKTQLEAIFAADRALRTAELSLLADQSGAAETLSAAVDEAASLSDRDEATMRLTRLSDLCAQVPGPRMADALIAILNAAEPQVRVAAGEAIVDVGYERYAEIARAIERALDAKLGGPAMTELPWVLAEIGEPSALPLIRRFTEHPDADVVAAAIEALAQLGDPDALGTLETLVDDSRSVAIDAFEQETRTTIGQLAQEAIAMLR